MSYVSYPLEHSDAELIEETKQVQQKNYFGKTEAYFKQMNFEDSYVYHFVNPTEKILECEF